MSKYYIATNINMVGTHERTTALFRIKQFIDLDKEASIFLGLFLKVLPSKSCNSLPKLGIIAASLSPVRRRALSTSSDLLYAELNVLP